MNIEEEVGLIAKAAEEKRPFADRLDRLFRLLDAFHEAGHAAVAWHLGAMVTSVYLRPIKRGRGGQGGHTQYFFFDLSAKRIEYAVYAAMAGELATTRVFPIFATILTSTSSSDRGQIRELTGRPARQVIKEYAPVVEAILDTTWPVVRAVAQCLIDGPEDLNAGQFQRLAEQAFVIDLFKGFFQRRRRQAD